MAKQSLKSLKLINYKGFERHSISLRGANVLIGANNAGKSTALGALRLISAMLPAARRTAPTTVGAVEGRSVRGWPISAAAIDISALALENIRHDFRNSETRIEVSCSSGARVIASWAPAEDADGPEPSGVLSVISPPGKNILPRTIAQTLVPTISIVPTLTPLDQHESFVMDDTLRRHAGSRRAPRYFRNALFRLSEDEWQDFCSFVYERTPEVSNLSIRRSYGNKDDAFDLFYEEESSRNEREIAWAGDGIQIWLQALYHMWIQRAADVIILDEPDVFLHPDLQRRLARALFSSSQQSVLATHSVEILAEADPGSAVWIDRARRSAERPRTDGALALLGRRLGSGYELGVGRALRSRTVLFVEGDDAPVIAVFARTLGIPAVATSENYATVPLGGFSKNWRASAFSETMAALGGDVASFIILDSDLRSQVAIDTELAQVRTSGARVHVWARREIENYVLDSAAIAKVAGVPQSRATDLLDSAIEGQRDEAATALQAQRLDERRLKGGGAEGHSMKTILENSAKEFNSLWATEDGRISTVDAKLVIKALNRELSRGGNRTLNVQSLAKSIPASQVPAEISAVISEFNQLIGRP
ncbi:ATP-binding protein [Microbacterium sp. 5K110]|jgi:hypothetical protein|uniref:ATP-dependent nuclease n=1 Tax=unclassified Microbacterium TaxID=2609290 RepID=UPI0010FF0BA2|nr:ATP-binding protein [Microbacterium sp. 5K110]TLF28838.1 hypothetical protein FE256_13810 [Microbacterium sp. 5K110]